MLLLLLLFLSKCADVKYTATLVAFEGSRGLANRCCHNNFCDVVSSYAESVAVLCLIYHQRNSMLGHDIVSLIVLLFQSDLLTVQF